MRKILVFTFVLLALGVKSQNKEVTDQDILNFKSCYENIKSHGLKEKNIDIEGEVFNLMSECHFAEENIFLSDKDELQKFSNQIAASGNKRCGYIIDMKSISEIFGGEFQGIMKVEEAVTSGYTQEGTFHLLCHGLSDQTYNSLDKIRLDSKVVDAKKASEIILKEMEGYEIITKYTKRPVVVVIHSCGVGGKSNNSFASKLSGYLAEKSPNIYVVAAPGKVYPSVNTWPYTETVKDDKGVVVNWNCFHGGKFISEGEKDFAATVTKIQKTYLK